MLDKSRGIEAVSSGDKPKGQKGKSRILTLLEEDKKDQIGIKSNTQVSKEMYAIYLAAADQKLNYGHDDGIISELLKKIRDLEERDREFDRKLNEIGLLKEQTDEAQKRLANMHELEYRLQKAEELIRTLENRLDNNNVHCKVNESDTIKVNDTNRGHNMDTAGTGSVPIRQAVSNIQSRQAKMDDKIAELVNFNNRIQTVQDVATAKDLKRTVTRKVAFTVTFSTYLFSVTPGRPFRFDMIEYNEGSAYNAQIGIFTCPVSGTYFFFTNVLSLANEGLETNLILDGRVLGTTKVFGHDNRDQGSTAAAIHCIAGQRVWVEGKDGNHAYGYKYSSFSGILLWPSDAGENSN
ncbi:hypothetical protein CHS0354_042310 [Potamilus streckersoni]|uniref:C1q domain-containing protein n=1 Tax=Potamilus streckersoni TaxID=2493646 RepID=A0AAE0W1G6_9BIVA|nr:hypothetical protein CHS0354_042310 [Potamilus streckersoni]